MGEERIWSWDLATGESVVAKVERAGTEAVYLGGHLLSRCLRGKKPDGHAIRMHGATEGAYRGEKDIRVFFEDERCRLVIDGETVQPLRSPGSETPAPDAPNRPASGGRSVPPLLFVLVAIFIAVTAGMAAYRAESRKRALALSTEVALTRLPSTLQHRDHNNLMTVHYPPSFSLQEAAVGSGATKVTLRGNVGYEELSLFSWTHPDSTDLWKLENGLHDAEARGWASYGVHFVGEELRSDGKCHGEESAIVERHLVLAKGAHVLQWSCTFVKDGHGFRFSTFTSESVPRDEAYLNGLIDAVEL